MSLISYICYFLLLEIGIGDGLDLTCTQVYLQPGEPFIAQSKQSILIEQENNHYEFRENYHQTSITVELQIQYEFEGILLSSIIIDKVDDIYLKDICNLHFDGFYFIQCIQGLYLSNLKLFNKSNYQKSKFIVPTQTNEQCNQLYKDSNNIMVVHCFSDSHFILYFLNPIKHLFSNIKFQYFPQLSYCNRMFKQFQFDHYLHIIYQCSQWSIQVLKNGLELEVINQESMQKNFNFQLQKELENLEVCYPLLYLIDGTEYVILRFVKDNFQLLKNSDEEIGLIKKLILDMNCNIKFILTQNFNDEQKLYLQTANYLKLINYNLSTTRIEYFNKFLFLLEKNFLEVHLNCFEKEKYNINSEFIYFPPNQNYFYQFDSIQEILTLYLFSLKNWIQNPKKQFILSISTEFYECCNENEIQCFQINLENNIQTYSPAVNNLIKLEIGCDNIGTSLLNKDQFNLRFPYKINDIFSNQIRIICNIIKNEIILNNCTNLNYKNKDIIILQYSIGVDYENIVFMQNNTIYFLNCRQNQSISQIDLGNKSVLYYRNSFLAINQQQQQLEIFGFSNNSTFQFINITLKNQIDYVIQNQEKALIFFKGNLYEQPLPMIVLINQIQYPTNRYLDEKLFFNEQVYYFFYIQNLLLIQYKDFFVVKYFDNYYKIYIENIQIVAVSVRVRFELKIIAIQDSTNKLLQYCLQFSSLKLVNSYSMYDYKIIQPVKYQISQNYLSILTTQNNNKYLMIFQFEYIPDVKLEQIIKISKDQYFFISAQIFYYDAQGDFQTINLQTFKISCQLNQQNYSEMQQYNIINLELISQIDDSKIGQTNLQILTINQCQDLKPKQPKIIVKHNSNSTQIIYLADYFYGDVDKLYLNKQCNAKLSGPFIIKDQIEQCKSQSQNSEICQIIIEYHHNSDQLVKQYYNFSFKLFLN
ncbi:unnamed protein product [Paramecium primaurelia]|uniref:Transmembrane protein n=1 Tax=Paramecium primaurelia TaxID=5886 RepID=A0A8S1QA51_PARPR|nr:unnamed protein product [Paramecium primaurelia]